MVLAGSGMPAWAARKPGGETSDPCTGAASRGFPAFGFSRPSSGQLNWEYRFADQEGKCDTLVWSSTWTVRYADVTIRYDAVSSTGIAVASGGPDRGLVAAGFAVGFDASGRPSVAADPFQTILTREDLAAQPLPDDPLLADWQIGSMGGAQVGPSGTAVLFTSVDTAWTTTVHWICALAIPIDPTTCNVVYYRTNSDGGFVSALWGGRGDSIYFTARASNGSGDSLYRKFLGGTRVDELFSRGTSLTAAATTVRNGVELVVIREAAACPNQIVIDADTCDAELNNCSILNGAGHIGAAGLTWLPDGRVAVEQMSIGRRGSCTRNGMIAAFHPTDTNGGLTTLVKGESPDGAR
jgi:hypothetical protein